MSDAKGFYELKEKAKWSGDVQEKKLAIRELTSYGEKALSSLEEIGNVTVYEDIKLACIEAIKSIKETSATQPTLPGPPDTKKRKKSKTRPKPKQN